MDEYNLKPIGILEGPQILTERIKATDMDWVLC
jgi:hypothetical protein